MIRRSPLKRGRKRSKYARRAREFNYLAWIRSLPCAICGTRDSVEAAHVGVRAFGQKCPDSETIPLCSQHHRLGPYAHHVLGRRFFTHHQLDREDEIAQYRRDWEATQ